jgi:hypothetical protein
MRKLRIDVRRWDIAPAAVSRRPPIPLDTIVARTHMYTYAANVCDLSIVQGPFSVAPSQTLTIRFATLFTGCEAAAIGAPSAGSRGVDHGDVALAYKGSIGTLQGHNRDAPSAGSRGVPPARPCAR